MNHDLLEKSFPRPAAVHMMAPPAWDTSSEGAAAHTKPLDLETLGRHTSQCSVGSGRWAALRCGAQVLLGFVSARLVTSLAVLAALVGVWLMWR